MKQSPIKSVLTSCETRNAVRKDVKLTVENWWTSFTFYQQEFSEFKKLSPEEQEKGIEKYLNGVLKLYRAELKNAVEETKQKEIKKMNLKHVSHAKKT